MKKQLLILYLLLNLFGSYTSIAQTTVHKYNAPMIRHSVVFKFKPSIDSVAAQNFFIAASKLATIPGVQNFESLRQISKKNKFEYGLSMDFANDDLYQQYNNHPVHIKFIRDYWLNYIEDYMEIDYQLL